MLRNIDETDLDLGALFNASPNAYVVFSPDLTIVGCNDAYLSVTGRRREEIAGRGLFEAFPADPASESYRLLRGSLERVVQTQRQDHLALVPYDTSRAGEGRRMRYWSATHTPLFDGAGNFRFILQHTVDVTELHELRERRAITEVGLLRRAHEVQAGHEAALAQSAALRGLFKQAPGFVAILNGAHHVFQFTNDAYDRLVGRGDLAGKTVAEALPEVVGQGFVTLLDSVFRTGEAYTGRGVAVLLRTDPAGPPVQRHVDFNYQPIRDESGGVVGIFVQGHDVTEQHAAERELAHQGEIMRLAQEAGGFGTFEWDVAKGTVQASPTFKRIYGFEPELEQIPVARFGEVVHPDDLHRLGTAAHARLEDALAPTEYRILLPDGVRWVGRRGVVIRDEEGAPVRVLGAVQDITGRKQFEHQMETVARESAHRLKNILALVQAIVSQTLRKVADPVRAREIISERLSALAATQSALIEGAQGVTTATDLRVLAENAMAPHAAAFAGRIAIEGPPVSVGPRTALGLGLMLHELATNAIKYGALSVETGFVAIGWRPAEAAGTVELHWRESGGPPVEAPAHRGFGSSLIERGLAHDKRNRVVMDFAPEGLVCVCTIALDGE